MTTMHERNNVDRPHCFDGFGRLQALVSLAVSGLGLLACGGGSQGTLGASTQESPVVVNGIVSDYEGNPVSGMYVTADYVPDPAYVDPRGLASVRSAADGTFTLFVPSPGERVVVVALPERSGDGAIAHAPTLGVVSPKPGVSTYELPLRVPTVRRFDASEGSVELSSGERRLTLKAPTGAVGEFFVAGISPTSGIPLDSEGAEQSSLQSLGMLYVAPAPGAELPPGGFVVDVGPDEAPEIPGASPFATWTLSPDGRWVQVALAGNLANQSLTRFGFWNCDRLFPTVCVRGRVKSPSGRCGGRRVTQSGPVGVASYDNLGADGGFCVTGAPSFRANVSIGAASFSWSTSDQPGSCNSPNSCVDVGEIELGDEDCPNEVTEPPDVMTECEGEAASGPSSLEELMNGYLSALQNGLSVEAARQALFVSECEYDEAMRALREVGGNSDVTYEQLRTEFAEAFTEDLGRRDWARCSVTKPDDDGAQAWGDVTYIEEPELEYDCGFGDVGASCDDDSGCPEPLSCDALLGTGVCRLPRLKFDAAVQVNGVFKILGP